MLDYRELDFSVVAFIDELRCIGCAKCIHACPVDAILGARKHMHTVIANECTGCKRCLEPCPVDCIVMTPADEGGVARPSRPAFERAIAARRRADFRIARLAREERADTQARQSRVRGRLGVDLGADLAARRQFVAAAVERVRLKRLAHERRPPGAGATPDE